MAVDFSVEYPAIQKIADQRGLDPLFIAAIRLAENGADGKQYGVLTAAAPDYDSQLRVCTRTIAGYLQEYDGNPFVLIEGAAGLKRLVYSAAFIQYVRNHYAPIGADNDPNSLNTNWLVNVMSFYTKFTQFGYPVLT